MLTHDLKITTIISRCKICTKVWLKTTSGLEAVRFGFERFAAAEVPVKFQSDTTIATSNLAASRLHEIISMG